MRHATFDVPWEGSVFQPSTGLLVLQPTDLTMEYIRVPRSARLRVQTFPELQIFHFMAGTRVVLELRFPHGLFTHSDAVYQWWLAGGKVARQAEPPARSVA